MMTEQIDSLTSGCVSVRKFGGSKWGEKKKHEERKRNKMIQFDSRLCETVLKDAIVRKKSRWQTFIAIMRLQPVIDPSNTAPLNNSLIVWRGKKRALVSQVFQIFLNYQLQMWHPGWFMSSISHCCAMEESYICGTPFSYILCNNKAFENILTKWNLSFHWSTKIRGNKNKWVTTFS